MTLKRYVGTAAQRAASAATGNAGDLFLETDTGREGVADGTTFLSALAPHALLDDLGLRKRTIVVIGDSICNFNGGPRNSPGAPAAGSSYYQARGYFVWAMALLKWPFVCLSNAGVGGQRTDQIAARFAADALALTPGWVDIEGGTNDVSQGRTPAQIMASLTSMYDSARRAGIAVIANTITTQLAFSGATLTVSAGIGQNQITVNAVPGVMTGDTIVLDYGTASAENAVVASAPTGSPGVTGSFTVTLTANLAHAHSTGAVVYNATKMAVLSQANALIESYWRNNPNGVLCNLASVYADPATGGPLAALCLDGTHPSIDGAALFGKVKADAVQRVLPAGKLWGAAGDGNLCANSHQTGTGGTFSSFTGSGSGTGQVATAWTLFAGTGAETVVGSKVARTDGIPGSWQQFVISGGTTGTINYQSQNVNSGTDWNVGDAVYLEVEFQGDGDVSPPPANGQLVNATLVCSGTAKSAQAMQAASGSDGTASYWPSDAVLRTDTITIPTGTTRLQIQLNVHVAAGTCRIGRVRLVKGTP